MITQKELAERWGLSPGRVSQLVSEGMPLDSLEAADAWRSSRKRAVSSLTAKIAEQAVSGATSEAGEESPRLDPSRTDAIDDALDKQRKLVSFARSNYLRALRNGDASASRLFTAYDKSLAMLLKVEKEATARALASRQLISRNVVLERLRKVLSSVRTELELAEFSFAPKANPDNPAIALKAFQDFRREVLKNLSSQSSGAVASLFGEDFGESGVDPVEPVDQREPIVVEPDDIDPPDDTAPETPSAI